MTSTVHWITGLWGGAEVRMHEEAARLDHWDPSILRRRVRHDENAHPPRRQIMMQVMRPDASVANA